MSLSYKETEDELVNDGGGSSGSSTTTFTVCGYVKCSDSELPTGATIYCSSNGNTKTLPVTGYFSFTGLTSSGYILVKKTGYGDYQQYYYKESASNNTITLEITLIKCTEITILNLSFYYGENNSVTPSVIRNDTTNVSYTPASIIQLEISEDCVFYISYTPPDGDEIIFNETLYWSYDNTIDMTIDFSQFEDVEYYVVSFNAFIDSNEISSSWLSIYDSKTSYQINKSYSILSGTTVYCELTPTEASNWTYDTEKIKTVSSNGNIRFDFTSIEATITLHVTYDGNTIQGGVLNTDYYSFVVKNNTTNEYVDPSSNNQITASLGNSYTIILINSDGYISSRTYTFTTILSSTDYYVDFTAISDSSTSVTTYYKFTFYNNSTKLSYSLATATSGLYYRVDESLTVISNNTGKYSGILGNTYTFILYNNGTVVSTVTCKLSSQGTSTNPVSKTIIFSYNDGSGSSSNTGFGNIGDKYYINDDWYYAKKYYNG